MRIEIVQIGNSKGIRIPKSILETCHFKDAVELEVENGVVILRNANQKPRERWSEAYKLMAAKDHDRLLDKDEISTKWDDTEWQW